MRAFEINGTYLTQIIRRIPNKKKGGGSVWMEGLDTIISIKKNASIVKNTKLYLSSPAVSLVYIVSVSIYVCVGMHKMFGSF